MLYIQKREHFGNLQNTVYIIYSMLELRTEKLKISKNYFSILNIKKTRFIGHRNISQINNIINVFR